MDLEIRATETTPTYAHGSVQMHPTNMLCACAILQVLLVAKQLHTPAAPALIVAGSWLHMLPKQAHILLMHANHLNSSGNMHAPVYPYVRSHMLR